MDKRLMGVLNDEFPVFQKQRDGIADFTATAVKWMLVSFGDVTNTEKEKKSSSKNSYR